MVDEGVIIIDNDLDKEVHNKKKRTKEEKEFLLEQSGEEN